MGIETRPNLQKSQCTCFIIPTDVKPEHLCYRKSVIGALSDEQMVKLCIQKSMKSEKDGGTAKDVDSTEVKSILRTMKNFTRGVAAAKVTYKASGARDIPAWREAVKSEVRRVAREKVKEVVNDGKEKKIAKDAVRSKVRKG
jgi:hypothetical protein